MIKAGRDSNLFISTVISVQRHVLGQHCKHYHRKRTQQQRITKSRKSLQRKTTVTNRSRVKINFFWRNRKTLFLLKIGTKNFVGSALLGKLIQTTGLVELKKGVYIRLDPLTYRQFCGTTPTASLSLSLTHTLSLFHSHSVANTRGR